ncbi:MAG TPA: type IV toxin-antitoxin system AbiEi family antitoxin domain-containing protein [Solirubrobacteraceae bacterium]|nr:type IV toxin-antitoxin system AbiEi family antitoxin domain-containing protein [Solirubrobacteraceae bacterium]
MRSQTPDEAVARLAQRQHGNVTYDQLRACGLTDMAVRWRAHHGRLFPVHQAVYAVGRPPRTPIERAAAAVLACGPGAALSDEGALALWGFSTHWPSRFDVVVVAGDRRPKGIATHRYRNLRPRDLTVHFGIRTTSPARTVLDCAPRLTNRRVIPDALHGPFLTEDQLADVRARFPTHPGARLLDPFLEGYNPTRSPLEDDFVTFCARHGLPRPETNVKIAGHTVDALFRAQRLIVEIDSWEFHKDREAFETDRTRDADTLQAGFRTIRLTDERMRTRADAEAARLHRILSAPPPGGYR